MSGKKRIIKLRTKIADCLDLPHEVVDGARKITVLDNEHIIVENYNGIYELFDKNIKVLSASGTVTVDGEGLVLKELSMERLYILGNIKRIELE